MSDIPEAVRLLRGIGWSYLDIKIMDMTCIQTDVSLHKFLKKPTSRVRIHTRYIPRNCQRQVEPKVFANAESRSYG